MVEGGARLRQALRRAGPKVLLEIGGGRISRTGDELLERAECLAARLVSKGYSREVIVLHFANGAAALEAAIAVELTGGTRVPVEKNASPDEVFRIARAAAATLIFSDNHEVAPHGTETDAAQPAWFYDDSSLISTTAWKGAYDVEPDRLLIRYPRSVAGDALRSADTTYGNWAAALDLNIELYRNGGYGPPIAADDVLVTSMGLMHFSGWVGSWPFLLLGLKQILFPKFDAAAIAAELETGTATSFVAVPKMLSRIAALRIDEGISKPFPDGKVRRILYGGGPVTPDDVRRDVHIYPDALCQLYGSYEAGWPLAILSANDHRRAVATGANITSCGGAHDGVELAVWAGTLHAKSAMSAPSATDPDGWCRLEDRAQIDDDGYVQLLGRADAMINTGGFHVFPEEVTEALLGLDGVTGAVVRGEPDPEWGEAVVAYVTGPADIDIEAISTHLRNTLATYKVPKRIQQVDELPTEASHDASAQSSGADDESAVH